MRTKSLFVCMISIILAAATCKKEKENCHYHLSVLNNSNKPIYVAMNLNYPDTSITDPNPFLSPELSKVNSGVKNHWGFSFRDCIEDVFQYRIPSDTIMVFIFDSAILSQNSWNLVKQNYLVLRRSDLSLQDLKDKKFLITYP